MNYRQRKSLLLSLVLDKAKLRMPSLKKSLQELPKAREEPRHDVELPLDKLILKLLTLPPRLTWLHSEEVVVTLTATLTTLYTRPRWLERQKRKPRTTMAGVLLLSLLSKLQTPGLQVSLLRHQFLNSYLLRILTSTPSRLQMPRRKP